MISNGSVLIVPRSTRAPGVPIETLRLVFLFGVAYYHMMTSSNGNIFRVTGPLCGEFTGPGEFPTQRPVTRSFDVFFDLRLNKRLSKQPWGWWFETPSWSLWRQCNDINITMWFATISLLLALINFIPAWICNHIHRKVWDEITSPFANLNDSTVEVWEWISNSIPHLVTDVTWLGCESCNLL